MPIVSAVCAAESGEVGIVVAAPGENFLGAGDARQAAGIERPIGVVGLGTSAREQPKQIDANTTA